MSTDPAAGRLVGDQGVILRRHGFVATFFVITAAVESGVVPVVLACPSDEFHARVAEATQRAGVDTFRFRQDVTRRTARNGLQRTG